MNTLTTFRPGQIIVGGGQIVKVAKVTNPKRDQPWHNHGQKTFTIDKVNLRTVPPGFMGGELAIGNYGSLDICKFAHGDQEAYQDWVSKGRWHIDVNCVAVGDGTPIPELIDCKRHRFTKPDLMAYAILVNGPLTRDEIMRKAAALEGLPWIPTSNTEYFATRGECVGTVLVEAGKRGQKKLYTLGQEGKERANRVLVTVGEGPGRAAK